jgi:hypothetical protein
LNDQAGRSIPIVAHVFTLDCESLKLQLGNGRGNWYEVQITGRPRSLPGRTCLTVRPDKRLAGSFRGGDSTCPPLRDTLLAHACKTQADLSAANTRRIRGADGLSRRNKAARVRELDLGSENRWLSDNRGQVRRHHQSVFAHPKSFNNKFPYIRDALVGLPVGTVIDGEVVAIDETGRPNFNLLQSFRTSANQIQYYVFDLICSPQS